MRGSFRRWQPHTGQSAIHPNTDNQLPCSNSCYDTYFGAYRDP